MKALGLVGLQWPKGRPTSGVSLLFGFSFNMSVGSKPATISKTLSGLKFMQRAAEQKKLLEQEKDKEAMHASGQEEDPTTLDKQPTAPPVPEAAAAGPPSAPKCKIIYESRPPGFATNGRFSVNKPEPKDSKSVGGTSQEEVAAAGSGQDKSGKTLESGKSGSRPENQGKKRKGEASDVSDVEMAALAFQRGPQKGSKRQMV